MTQNPSTSPATVGGTKLVIVAVVLALVAVVLVNLYIEVVRRQATEDTFTVYFLTQSVRPMEKLTKDKVRAEQVPRRFEGAFKNTIGEDGLESRMGETFQRAAASGQPLTPDLFALSAVEREDATINPAMRRVPLRVNSKTLPGSLRPGMYVDIAAPFINEQGKVQVLMVMERVQVRAMGQMSIAEDTSAQRRITNYPTIEIDVTPEEALALSEIQRRTAGDFELYLRNPADSGAPMIEAGGINPQVLQLIGQQQIQKQSN